MEFVNECVGAAETFPALVTTGIEHGPQAPIPVRPLVLVSVISDPSQVLSGADAQHVVQHLAQSSKIANVLDQRTVE